MIFAQPLKQTLVSQEDQSVNFVFETGQEARYVRRSDDYFIVYLSSHGGCDRACRFCHLTQTGQTEMRAATVPQMVGQAEQVIEHYKQQVLSRKAKPARTVHFNWMARGEPLLNDLLVRNWMGLAARLEMVADAAKIPRVRFNISTIMPKELGNGIYPSAQLLAMTEHLQSAPHLKPVFFYSAYSAKEEFRRRWLPKAHSLENAIAQLGILQRKLDVEVVIHHALIRGQNDSLEDAHLIGEQILLQNLNARFNLVRYNPYAPAQGEEPDEDTIWQYLQALEHYMTVPGSRIVPRVGHDVKASCGMFVNQ